MSEVQAVALQVEGTQVSDGNDTAFDFGHDAFENGTTWIDVTSFVRLTVYVSPGAAGADFTINAKATPNAPSEALYAKATSASAARIQDAVNIEGYGFIQILEDGTATQSQSVYILAK